MVGRRLFPVEKIFYKTHLLVSGWWTPFLVVKGTPPIFFNMELENGVPGIFWKLLYTASLLGFSN